MSYNCNMCHRHFEGIRCIKVPTSFREKTYQNGNRTSFGYEIEKEISVCPDCNERYSIERPAKRVNRVIKQKKKKSFKRTKQSGIYS